jgi:hypothetical protein
MPLCHKFQKLVTKSIVRDDDVLLRMCVLWHVCQ